MKSHLEEVRAAIVKACPEIADRPSGFVVVGNYPPPVIRLADVLRAINSQFVSVNSSGDFMFKRMNGSRGEFAQLDWFYSDAKGRRGVWNLAADSLDDQPEETIAFLHSILCKPV